MSYRKLKKEEITVDIEESKKGGLLLIVGMYEKDNWRQGVVIRLTNFPEICEKIDKFDFTIDGAKTE